jgi:GT2 family glycosyltransferase
VSAPRVSVLMPIHNQAELLPTTLRTVLAQRFSDFEVLVSGDGCEDASEAVARSTGDPRVRWLGFPKAPGFGYENRARALAEARGDYVAYLAPDDLWAPDHLEHLVASADLRQLDLVFCRPISVTSDGELLPHFAPFDIGTGQAFPAVGPRIFFLSPSQTLHTREIHARAGGWRTPPLRHGDIDLWRRCRAAGARIAYDAHPSVLRLPSYAFSQSEPRRLLHERLAAELIDGSLRLDQLRWPLPRRVAGWGRDALSVARARWRSMARYVWDAVSGS